MSKDFDALASQTKILEGLRKEYNDTHEEEMKAYEEYRAIADSNKRKRMELGNSMASVYSERADTLAKVDAKVIIYSDGLPILDRREFTVKTVRELTGKIVPNRCPSKSDDKYCLYYLSIKEINEIVVPNALKAGLNFATDYDRDACANHDDFVMA